MVSESDIKDIFDKITETYQDPVPIGGRCESNVYYRTEDLTDENLNMCAEFVAFRIRNVTSPYEPEVLFKLPGGYSFFAERLFAFYKEISPNPDKIELVQYLESKITNGQGETYRGRNTVLITDVITTARSSLEAHTKATLKGINVLCWATLIDRTFGPGPVPVVSALTGAPVRVLSNM